MRLARTLHNFANTHELLVFDTNKIEFTELTITNNQKNNELMWKKINSVKPIKITFPVIINNEKLTHSHNDLDLFLKNLK